MKNLEIRMKLSILVLFMLLGIIIIGSTSVVFMAHINDGSTVISKNWVPSIIVAEELNTLTSDFRIAEYRHILAQDASEMQEPEKVMSSLSTQIDDMFSSYTNLITNDTDKKLLATAKDAWSSYLECHDRVLEKSRSNQTEMARTIMREESQQLFDTASNTFLQIVEFNKTGADQASLDGDNLYASARSLTMAIILAVVVIAIVGSLYIINSIVKPVREIDHVAVKIAEGNLNESITYQSRDELGKLAVNFNKTVTRLRDYVNYIDEISSVLNEVAGGNLMFQLTYDYAGEFAKVKTALENISASLNDTLGQINRSADQVAGGSDQVSSGAQALSQGATEQASSVQELAATIAEISSQVQSNAENARIASGKANQVGEEMQISNEKMQDMIKAMSDISNSSSEIGKIIKTIEDIAFQTNILALNAAVEAARAGAAGKGFAVVADEVRNLANKSSEASKNTAALIEGSLKAVENGTQIADATAQSLVSAVEGAKDVAATIDKISAASEMQSQSIIQVTTGVDQISSVVQTNSATAEESAAASEELSSQAQMLKHLVSRFKLKDAASGPAMMQSAPPAALPSSDGFVGSLSDY